MEYITYQPRYISEWRIYEYYFDFYTHSQRRFFENAGYARRMQKPLLFVMPRPIYVYQRKSSRMRSLRQYNTVYRQYTAIGFEDCAFC